MPLHSIAVVAFDRVSPFHLSVPCLIFGDRHPGVPAFDFQVCAAEPGPLKTTAGFSLLADAGLGGLAVADTIIVPSWRDPDETPPKALLDALLAAHARGARLIGLCLGAYVLAEAGLLEGRQATTHWAYAAHFSARYPSVLLNQAVLYVEDGSLVTSAGTAAGLDCCLFLVRQAFGTEVANRLARRLVVAPHRQGGQAQYIEQPIPATQRGGQLGALLDWMRTHLAEDHSVDALAERLLMSRRTFTRHFREVTGGTLGAWLLAERLRRAQALLESSDLGIEQVAYQAGFGSVESLRLQFRRAQGVSPATWRKTFRG